MLSVKCLASVHYTMQYHTILLFPVISVNLHSVFGQGTTSNVLLHDAI